MISIGVLVHHNGGMYGTVHPFGLAHFSGPILRDGSLELCALNYTKLEEHIGELQLLKFYFGFLMLVYIETRAN